MLPNCLQFSVFYSRVLRILVPVQERTIADLDFEKCNCNLHTSILGLVQMLRFLLDGAGIKSVWINCLFCKPHEADIFSHGWSLSSSSSWWSDDDDDNHDHHRDDPMMIMSTILMVQFKDEGAWKCNWALHWNKYARTTTAVSLLSFTFKFHFQLSLLSFTFNCHFNNTIYFLFEFNCNNSITFTFVISAAAASFNSQLL